MSLKILEPTSPQLNGIISHVADQYQRYPGETIVFYTRLKADALLSFIEASEKDQVSKTLWMSVFLPRNLKLIDFSPMGGLLISSVSVADQEDGILIQWKLARDTIAAESEFEFITRALVDYPGGRQPGMALEAPVTREGTRQIGIASLKDEAGFTIASESAQILIYTQSKLMKYLPEIYQENEFMGRFLMLFESFWSPVEAQISKSEVYYDPDLTPAYFLPWLASWIGITWDDLLPEENKRRLLGAAISLFRRRGTRGAIEDFMKLYSGGEVSMIEHRAHNLVLGSESTMGIACALGKENRPHTFSMSLKVSRSFLNALFGITEDEGVIFPDYAEQRFLQRVDELVNAQKPAHTSFRVNLEVIDDIVTELETA